MVGIKGFRMPSSCSDCDLCYDMCACSILEVEWEEGFVFSSDFDNKRSQNCPLIEIKEECRNDDK